jgi:hypothetical protein
MDVDPAPLPPGPLPGVQSAAQIERFLGRVGQTLVYAGRLGASPVRITEYCPAGVARRDDSGNLVAASALLQPYWNEGVRRFGAQGQALSRILDSAVNRVWRADLLVGTPAALSTAYLVGAPIDSTLSAALSGMPRLAPAEVMHLARQLGNAMRVVHARNILHLDICPETIAISETEARLADFATDPRPYMRILGSQEGLVRPDYAPMELQDGSMTMPLGPATDIYSACVVLHRLIAGSLPPRWPERIGRQAAPLLGEITGFPAPFVAAVRQGLSAEPSDRFHSAEAWLAAMRLPAVAGRNEVHPASRSPGPKTPSGTPRPVASRKRAALILTAAWAAGLAVAGTWYTLNRSHPQTPANTEADTAFGPAGEATADASQDSRTLGDANRSTTEIGEQTLPQKKAAGVGPATAEPSLGGTWHGENDAACRNPVRIDIDGSKLTYSRGGIVFPERIVGEDGDSVVTEVVSGPSSGMRFSFRLSADAGSFTSENERWTRCAPANM